jgi:hypothetical protein
MSDPRVVGTQIGETGRRMPSAEAELLRSDVRDWLLGDHYATARYKVDTDTMLVTWADGLLESGLVLSLIANPDAGDTDNPLVLAPYLTAGAGGQEVAAGHLLDPLMVAAGTEDFAEIVWHGRVDVAALPAGNLLDNAARADLRGIVYVG